jgi:hypothetical protein
MRNEGERSKAGPRTHTHGPVIWISRPNKLPILLGGLPVLFHGDQGRGREILWERERRETLGGRATDETPRHVRGHDHENGSGRSDPDLDPDSVRIYISAWLATPTSQGKLVASRR